MQIFPERRPVVDIFWKARAYATICERGYLEAQHGRWGGTKDLVQILENGQLTPEEQDFLGPESLTQDQLNRATWFCEPLTVLLWVLKAREMPPLDSDVSILGPLNSAGELSLEGLEARDDEECEQALLDLFWFHRRIYAFFNGHAELDLVTWIEKCGHRVTDNLDLSGGDLRVQEESPLELGVPESLPCGSDFMKVSGSRLSALRWVLGVPLQHRVVDDIASPYALLDGNGAGLEKLSRNDSEKSSGFGLTEIGSTAIHNAVVRGDLQELEELVTSGHSLESTDIEGLSPINLAAFTGVTAAVAWMQEQGISVDCTDPWGRYPLLMAIRAADLDMMDSLLEMGAGADGPAGTDPPIFEAISSGLLESVEVLAEGGCDIDERNSSLDTPLIFASNLGAEAIVSHLIGEQARLDYVNFNENTALHMACGRGHVGVVKLLLEARAPLEKLNSLGLTPLAQAAHQGREECVLELLDAGANHHVIANNGQTPLHYSCRLGKLDLVEALLARGGDADLASDNNYTPLHAAALSGRWEVLEAVLCYAKAVSVADGQGMTPLHTAANRGYPEMVEALLSEGAELEAETQYQETPLTVCCFGHCPQIALELLLEAGVQIDHQDQDGNTALHLLASGGHADCVQLLLDRDAETELVNNAGLTARQWAEENGFLDVVELL